MTWTENLQEQLKSADYFASKFNYDMATYVLRDLKITELAGFKDLLWELCKTYQTNKKDYEYYKTKLLEFAEKLDEEESNVNKL